MIRKCLVILLALLIVVMPLAACAGSPNGVADNAQTTDTPNGTTDT